MTRSSHSPWRALTATLVAISIVVAAPFARATVAIRLTREELVAGADLVVRARVGTHESHYDPAAHDIVTLTRIEVISYLKGAGARALTVRQRGGQVGDAVEIISGNPVLTQGQDVILFLRTGPGVVYVSEMAQSVYYIAGTLAHRDLSGLQLVPRDRSHARQSDAIAEGPEALETLLSSVRRLARTAR